MNVRKNFVSMLVIGALSLITASLGFVGFRAGPAVTEVQFNSEQLTTLPAQRLALNFTQELAEVPQDLQITPALDFSAAVSGKQLVFTFQNALKANTEYTISGSVTSTATGAKTDIGTTFKTSALPLYVLVKKPVTTQTVASDRILSYTVGPNGGTQASEIFTAQDITEFTVQGDWLAVLRDINNSEVPNTEQRLTVQRLTGADRTEIPHPIANGLRKPQFSSDGSLLGIKFFNGQDDILWLYTLSNLNPNAVRTALDADGKEIPVDNWRFRAGSSTAEITTPNGNSYELPFGGVAQLSDTAPTQATLAAPTEQQQGADGQTAATLQDGAIVSVNTAGTSLIRTENGGETELYSPAADSSKILGFCLSPNAQYAAVLLTSVEGARQITVIEVIGGHSVLALNGDTVNWCG